MSNNCREENKVSTRECGGWGVEITSYSYGGGVGSLSRETRGMKRNKPSHYPEQGLADFFRTRFQLWEHVTSVAMSQPCAHSH